MGTYVGFGRSNHFDVKDAEEFEKFIARFTELKLLAVNEDENTFCILDEGQNGCLPDRMDDGEEFEEEIDFLQMISKHLKEEEGNIFVWRSIGYEKMKYLVGYTEAVDHNGKECWMNLDEFEKKCEKELGIIPDSRPEY